MSSLDPSPAASSPSPVAVALCTVTGNLFLVLGSAVCGTLAILGSWIPPQGHWVFFWARIWSRGLLAASGLRVQVSYEAELRGDCYVFMANHQSLYDIPALLATLPVQTRFLAKRELFRIPVFGWAIRAGGFIPVDRRDRSRARETFHEAVRRLRRGISVLVFPEETRSPDGRLLPFKRGGFLLALKSDLPVVPVGLEGTGAARRRGSLVIRPGRARVRYGAPLRGGGLADRAAFTATVRRRIEELAGIEAGGTAEPEADGKVRDH